MSKIAVIYWSGTGNTQQMAEAIANQAHADLFAASEFTADKAANYDAFAFGCSAMGAEQLEEDEFEPMWNAVAPVLGSKKVVLFGSYGWGGGEWMDIWKRDNAGLNIVAVCTILDREEGGREKLREAGYELLALFTRAELVALAR